MGELDHQILLRQFISDQEARQLAPRWKGARYALWENKKEDRTVLCYVVEWSSPTDAARFLADYRKAARRKWKRLDIASDRPQQVSGSADDGRFQWTLTGPLFTSVEGLP